MAHVLVTPYSALPCEAQTFMVNDIDADRDDFGYCSDVGDRSEVEPYCCACMLFRRKPCSQDVLDKYDITEREYNDICAILEKEFYVGYCSWCS